VVNDTSILTEAAQIIAERQQDYDSPDKNFQRIADLWSVLLNVKVTAEQVAMCMIAVKLTRLMHAYKRDSVLDIVGYSACLEQIAEKK
jgi:hypothetical protein